VDQSTSKAEVGAARLQQFVGVTPGARCARENGSCTKETGMTSHPIAKLKRFDESRNNIPGEHWLTLAAGVALWVATRKYPSETVRLLAGIVAGLLVARAASGTQIPQQLKRLVPYAGVESQAVLNPTGRKFR
jgi:hypothetical protein